jgi:hypothetical protein
LTFGPLGRILALSAWVCTHNSAVHKKHTQQSLKGTNMKKMFAAVLLLGLLCAGPAFAADPILGTWKLDVGKSKFSPGQALTAATRTYTEANGLYTLQQKLTSADGKEMSYQIHYRDGKDESDTTTPSVDATHAKKVDANTWDFDLKKDGKVVGRVHRVVSADGKTLTVHNTGTQISGLKGDETLVFDKQ